MDSVTFTEDWHTIFRNMRYPGGQPTPFAVGKGW